MASRITANSRKGNKNSRKGMSNLNNKGSFDPPQIMTNVIVNHRYRFRATAAFSGAISQLQVLSSLGTMGTVANTTVAHLFKSFRLKNIEIWAPPPSQGATVTTSVEWLGVGNSPNLEVSDTHVSVSRPAYLKTAPPPQSLASFWQISAGANLFNLVAPVGAIIDISYEMIMVDQTSASTTVGAATVTLGQVYYLALDHGTSDLLVPVSLTTTV